MAIQKLIKDKMYMHNPLVTDPLYLVYIWQKFRIKKKKGASKKFRVAPMSR